MALDRHTLVRSMVHLLQIGQTDRTLLYILDQEVTLATMRSESQILLFLSVQIEVIIIVVLIVPIRREAIIILVQTLDHRVQVQTLVRLALVVVQQLRVLIHVQKVSDRNIYIYIIGFNLMLLRIRER